jgi:RimJ/RimL family protein N-acetyltransferase
MVMDVPVIETERLILRAHSLDDFDALAALWSDPTIVRFVGGKPSTREETWARLLRYAGHWRLLGFGFWAVELKLGSRFIGDVGFANWERDITPSLDGLPEAGWVFASCEQGRGLATEAVKAAMSWMDVHHDGTSSTCIIGVENFASIRVAEKTGYREFARTEFKGMPVILFRRPPVTVRGGLTIISQ